MDDQEAKKNFVSGKFDYITPFYNQYHNNESLIEGLDSLLSSYDLSVNCIPFTSNTHPIEILPRISSRSRKIEILKKYDGIQLFQMIHRRKEDSGIKEEKGDFFIYQHPGYKNVYAALTIESNKFFRSAVLPFFKSLFPHVMMTFITHKRMRKLLEKFQIDNQFSKLIINRASHNFRLNGQGNGNGKQKKLSQWLVGLKWI